MSAKPIPRGAIIPGASCADQPFAAAFLLARPAGTCGGPTGPIFTMLPTRVIFTNRLLETKPSAPPCIQTIRPEPLGGSLVSHAVGAGRGGARYPPHQRALP